MKLIALSDGHGTQTAGKRTPTLPNGQKSELGLTYMNENLFNRAVIKYLDAELKRNGFRTLLVAPTDYDTPLAERTALADKHQVDLYMSVHANANNGQWGSWGGIETYTWNSGEGLRIGKLIHEELIKGSPLKNRGLKDGRHLWEIRKPKAPSVLVECGFMDSHNDYKYLLSDAYRKECAIEICKGICKAYGVSYKAYQAPKPQPKPTPTKPSVNAPTGSTHTVKAGDTLWALSRRYKLSVAELKALNGLKSDVLSIGQKLIVSKVKIHVVKTGDSLWALSRTYRTSVAQIKAWNGLKSDTIHPGDKLIVSN